MSNVLPFPDLQHPDMPSDWMARIAVRQLIRSRRPVTPDAVRQLVIRAAEILRAQEEAAR